MCFNLNYIFSKVLSKVIIIVLVFVLFFLNTSFSLILGTFFLALYCFSEVVKKPVSRNFIFLFSVLTVLMIPVFISLNHGFSSLFYYISTLICFFSARKMAGESPSLILHAFSTSFYFLFILSMVLYFIHREEAEPFGAIIEGVSTNGITSCFIVFQVVLSLVYFSVHKKLPLLTVVLTIIIAMLGLGRGSIIAALLILFFSLFFNYTFFLRYQSKLSLLSFVVFCCLCFYFFNECYSYFINETNLSRGLYDSYRADMIKAYINELDFISFYFGAAYEGTIISEVYGDNPHNSFVRAHSYLGLGPLLFIVFSPLYFYFISAPFSYKFVFSFFVLIILFRAFSEPILFPTIFDFFYIFIFLYFKNSFALQN